MASLACTDPDERVRAVSVSALSSLVVFPLLALLALDNKFDFVDDAYYVMLARSLAGGLGYSDINLPEPHFHQHFPPGLPLFLSASGLFGFDLSTDVIVYKVLLIICGAAGLYSFSRLARRYGYSPHLVSSAVLLSAVCITFVGFTTRVASEMLYLVLSMLTLLALAKYEESSLRSRWLLVSALLLEASILTRSIGIVILVSAVITWVVKREFSRAVLISVTVLVLGLPWLLLTSGSGAGLGSYYREFLSSLQSDSFFKLIRRAIENGWLLLDRDIPRVVLSLSASEFARADKWVNAALLPLRLGVSALVIAPVYLSLRKNPGIPFFYFASYLMLIVVWPWEPSRYVVPVVPFVCFAFILGLRMLSERVPALRPNLGMWPRKACFGVIAACIASQLISEIRFISVVRRSGHYSYEAASIWNETMTAYEWIRQNTPPSSVIGCEPAIGPHVFLFTGRKALALPRRPESYKQLGVTHIVHITDPTMYTPVDAKRRPDLQEFTRNTGGVILLALVYQTANVSIFEMR